MGEAARMKNILKAEFRKFFNSKFTFILLGIALIIPLFTTGGIKLLFSIADDGSGNVDEIIRLLSGPRLYATSFNLLNNVGLLLLITVVVLGSNDFSQNTIRNKIIAGYKKEVIYLSSLIYNLIIMALVMFIYSGATYLFYIAFNSFILSEFLTVLSFATIAFSGLATFYALVTIFIYKNKNIVGPLLISIGILILLIALYQVMVVFSTPSMDLRVIQHVFPIIRVLNPSFVFNTDTMGVDLDTSLWWVSLLVNLGHLSWLTLLGTRVAKKTDYK